MKISKYLWLGLAVAGLTTGVASAADVAAHQHGAAQAMAAAKDGKDAARKPCTSSCCSRDAAPTSVEYLRH